MEKFLERITICSAIFGAAIVIYCAIVYGF